MIPGPRPPKGHTRLSAGRDRGLEVVPPLRPDRAAEAGDVVTADECPESGSRPVDVPPVTLARTAQGWTVLCPSGASHADDLVEGLTLADLVAEDFGIPTEPDRTARRSARGPGRTGESAEDSPAGRTAALERTIAQLEHALAARVSTERAIGVLAERNRTSPRAAFESLRHEARSSGRPLADLAREVLSSLEELPGSDAPSDAGAGRIAPPGPVAPPAPRPGSRTGRPAAATSPVVAAADAGS